MLKQPPLVWTDQDARRTALKDKYSFVYRLSSNFVDCKFSPLFCLSYTPIEQTLRGIAQWRCLSSKSSLKSLPLPGGVTR